MAESTLPASARARVALDNLDQPPGLPRFLGTLTAGGLANDYLACQFTTGEAPYHLVIRATARLQNPETAFGVLAATYQASIWSYRDGLPDRLVAIFDTEPTLPAGSGPTSVCFASHFGIWLGANTCYWLAIRNTTGRQLSWVTARSPAGSSRLRGWRLAQDALAQRHRGGPWETAADGRLLQFSITVGHREGWSHGVNWLVPTPPSLGRLE